MVVVRWTGAAGLDITHEGDTILVDPYPSRLSKRALLGRIRCDEAAVERYLRSLPGRPRAVVVGHTHFDHALDIPSVARRLDGPVVGSASLATVLAMHGDADRVTVCRGGEEVALGAGASVRMVPSRHGRAVLGRVPLPGEVDAALRPPLRTRDYRHGTVFAPLLEVGGRRILHLGSADLVDDALAAAVGEQPVDLALVCVPGWRRCPDLLARLVRVARPRVLAPFHFDDFTTPFAFDWTARKLPGLVLDMDGFVQAVRAADARVRLVVPRPYEALHVA